jgi:hypothetical protein
MAMTGIRENLLAGATGLEPAASCVTGRRSNLGEAGCANVRENYRAKGVLFEETRLPDRFSIGGR